MIDWVWAAFNMELLSPLAKGAAYKSHMAKASAATVAHIMLKLLNPVSGHFVAVDPLDAQLISINRHEKNRRRFESVRRRPVRTGMEAL
ncbi:hypothetical protein [Azospirillum thermophilum]|uniref:hypothetical protein n=1 Tax=Azospirillum thermophilum TaxID=2202148 RepID=UPI0011B73C31|nr:hypothetical protein [Azospirillum thermophilum]